MPQPLYSERGRGFESSDLTGSPWDSQAQHGGALAALVSCLVERQLTLPVVRLQLSFLQAIPLAPLEVHLELLKRGRRSQLVTGSVVTEGTVLALVEAQALRRDPAVAQAVGFAAGALPPPSTVKPGRRIRSGTMFSDDAVEVRFVSGGYHQPGPATAWLRLQTSVIEGEDPSPLARAAAASDFGNGLSALLPWSDYLFVNTDLCLHLLRPPTGEWIGMQSRSELQDGLGLTTSLLHDEQGMVGRASQTLFVERRRPA